MEKLKKLQLNEVALSTEEAKLILGGGGGDEGDEYVNVECAGVSACKESCASGCSPGGKCASCQHSGKR